ncbi:MAG: SpoIID/LytB domain-containing protein [Angelakisella sp.]
MKGDLLLLGITGLAILVIPMAVLQASGSVPLRLDDGGSVASSSSPAVGTPSTTGAATGTGWQTTPIPGGQAVELPTTPPAESTAAAAPSSSAPPQQGNAAYPLPEGGFRILDRTSKTVETVSVKDYLRGAIAAEMPASFHLEALKAQGIAALSYALYHHDRQQQTPDPLLNGADFAADPTHRQGYMTEKAAKKFYGDNWQYNWGKVCQAAEEAVRWVLLLDAQNIWGLALPCLCSVDCSWDILAKDYRSTVTLSQGQIREALKDTEATLLPNADTWFAVEQTSPAGYVTQVRVGNATMTGNQLRNLLGLRSSSFSIERQGKSFLFRVAGYGHGAGLSQNGADYMARQGKPFDEILRHYYHGVALTPTQ